ncbi:MAG: CRISPR-associated protein [Candidatus Nitrosocaldaceae archaeon]|nr:MAG: CRISPR-associated protein [Candidatus Nitrosocaldaceae archaeon]
MDIILAPWGDPKGWKIVTYKYNNKFSSSFSSSLALADILDIPNENVIAIVSSTLIDRKVNDYNELVTNVRDNIHNTINDKYCNTKYDLNKIKPKIWVMPGIGSFRNGRFIHKGSTDLYYNSIYYNTLEYLKEVNEDVNLHIDLTHGINYMPVLAQDAIKLAASTFASMSGRHIKLFIYNSDPLYPFPGTDDPNIILDINNISTINYHGYKSLQPLLLDYVINYDHNIYNWKRIASSNSVDDILIYKGAKAASMGLLLVMGSIRDSLEMYKKHIEDTLSNLKDIKLECVENGNIIFRYNTMLRREASILHAIACALLSIDISSEVSITKLKDLVKLYYENVTEPVYNITINEIDSIKSYKDMIKEEYELYGKIKYGIKFDSNKSCKPNKRNLYAHAGFEENTIYLKKDRDEIYLSYENCLDEILKNI